jgi:hypothetical protein
MTNEPKTRSIGVLAAADVKKFAGFKEYKEAADAYAAARARSTKAKTALRDAIKQKLVAASLITDESEIDFTLGTDGRISVTESLVKKTGRQKTTNVLTLS